MSPARPDDRPLRRPVTFVRVYSGVLKLGEALRAFSVPAAHEGALTKLWPSWPHTFPFNASNKYREVETPATPSAQGPNFPKVLPQLLDKPARTN